MKSAGRHRHTDAPVEKLASMQNRPMSWNSGTQDPNRSSRVNPRPATRAASPCVTFSCVTVTPLGADVLPEVYWMTASSSSPAATGGGGGALERSVMSMNDTSGNSRATSPVVARRSDVSTSMASNSASCAIRRRWLVYASGPANATGSGSGTMAASRRAAASRPRTHGSPLAIRTPSRPGRRPPSAASTWPAVCSACSSRSARSTRCPPDDPRCRALSARAAPAITFHRCAMVSPPRQVRRKRPGRGAAGAAPRGAPCRSR